MSPNKVNYAGNLNVIMLYVDESVREQLLIQAVALEAFSGSLSSTSGGERPFCSGQH